MIKSTTLLLSLFLLISCASKVTKEQKALRDLVEHRNFDKALVYLDKTEGIKDKKSELLYYMEKGMIFHLKGDYFQSTQALEKAKEISHKLYTVSISKKAQTLVTNETYDIYYGESYERSLIHFYQALNHYHLYKLGRYESHGDPKKPIPEKKLSNQERRRELFSARAEIVAWDSLSEEFKNEKRGKSVFKVDLLAKVFGGMIHLEVGSRSDINIALQLFRDAREILFKNYNSYKTFNVKYREFKNDYDKLHKMSLEKVKSKYTVPTESYKSLQAYLEKKVIQLTKRVRPRELKKMTKAYGLKKGQVKKYLKENKSNVWMIIQNKIIPEKYGEKIYFGLGKSLRNPKNGALTRFGGTVLSIFAANVLGLVPPPSNYSLGGTYLGLSMANAAVSEIAISFELPAIKDQPNIAPMHIEVRDQSDKLIKKSPVVLVNPMGDIASEAVAERSSWLYPKVGTRLAIKHATAIATAFATYKALGGGGKKSSFLAKNAAVLEYIAATKLIEASEKADTRFWSTLPSEIRVTDFHLSPGKYKLLLLKGVKSKSLGVLEIKGGKQREILNYRVTF